MFFLVQQKIHNGNDLITVKKNTPKPKYHSNDDFINFFRMLSRNFESLIG